MNNEQTEIQLYAEKAARLFNTTQQDKEQEEPQISISER